MAKPHLLAAALLIGASTHAFAADAVVEDVVVVDSAYDWSGVYVGVQAGYGWGSNDFGYEDDNVDFDSDGFVGGLTAGVNWQNGSFVYGLEADISYSDVNGSQQDPGGPAPCHDEGCTADIEWFATGRARLGYAVDNFLPYVTGGFAVGRLEGTADLGACGFVSCAFDATEFGWTAGLGIEWGLTQNVSLKAEYLHIGFGTPDFSNDGGDAHVDSIDLDTVRVGLNYRF
ncbi:outer membrane protein [Mesorhizobium marinum]|uniref:outer membrane protein n=1 Tax=Mesorhizobium marinum TaxID=3228790 RepID=UPI003464EADC